LSQNPEFEHEEQDIEDVLELQFSSQSCNDLILETSHPSNSEAISSSDQRRPNPTIFPHVDNRSTVERCLAEILRAEELEQSFSSTSSEPDDTQIQTPDISECHQVNPVSISSDSAFSDTISSESEPLSFHLSTPTQFEIFLESSDLPYYDISDNDSFTDDLDTHSLVVLSDHICRDVCVVKPQNVPWCNCLDNLDELIHKPRVPFGNVALDLAIFTFDEPLAKTYLVVNNQTSEEGNDEGPIWDDEVIVKIQFPNSKEEILEDKLSVNNKILENTTLEFHQAKEVVEKNNEKSRRGMNRTRKTKDKNERMAAKLTKRLSSSNSPLKRTRWNDGKRARGNRP
jgi:hypothetical protein